MRTPVEILEGAGVPFTVHEHAPVASVAEILAALPFPAEEHVKTLAFDADGRVVLAALRGSDRVAYGSLARALGVARDRLEALPPHRVRDELGLEPGGVCPLVDVEGVVVLVDARVLGLPRAFCGSGSQRRDARARPGRPRTREPSARRRSRHAVEGPGGTSSDGRDIPSSRATAIASLCPAAHRGGGLQPRWLGRTTGRTRAASAPAAAPRRRGR